MLKYLPAVQLGLVAIRLGHRGGVTVETWVISQNIQDPQPRELACFQKTQEPSQGLKMKPKHLHEQKRQHIYTGNHSKWISASLVRQGETGLQQQLQVFLSPSNTGFIYILSKPRIFNFPHSEWFSTRQLSNSILRWKIKNCFPATHNRHFSSSGFQASLFFFGQFLLSIFLSTTASFFYPAKEQKWQIQIRKKKKKLHQQLNMAAFLNEIPIL